MATDQKPNEQKRRQPRGMRPGGASEAVYGMGFIGALIYYLSHAATFWLGVLGFFKALAWPVFLVYDLMKFLNM